MLSSKLEVPALGQEDAASLMPRSGDERAAILKGLGLLQLGAKSGPPSPVRTGSEIERLSTIVERLQRMVAYDPLTGLPTRSVLLERLERELAQEAADEDVRIAVLFVDLDNFKLVNDSLGHGSGDAVLCEMAKRIGSCLGSQDIASRFGGDEVVILHPVATDVSGTALGRRILAAMAEPIFIAGREVVVTASVGLALCRPGMKTVEQLLREADTALYAAKGRGRARLNGAIDIAHGSGTVDSGVRRR